MWSRVLIRALYPKAPFKIRVPPRAASLRGPLRGGRRVEDVVARRLVRPTVTRTILAIGGSKMYDDHDLLLIGIPVIHRIKMGERIGGKVGKP